MTSLQLASCSINLWAQKVLPIPVSIPSGGPYQYQYNKSIANTLLPILFVFHINNTANRAPQYLADCVQTIAQSSSRSGLRSAERRWHSYLHKAMLKKNQVRRLWLSLCRTCCLEQSPRQAPPY